MATANVIMSVTIFEGSDIPEEFVPDKSPNSQRFIEYCRKNQIQSLYSGVNYNLTDELYSTWLAFVKINYDNMNQIEPGDYWQVRYFRDWLIEGDEPKGKARVLGMRIGERIIDMGFEKEK